MCTNHRFTSIKDVPNITSRSLKILYIHNNILTKPIWELGNYQAEELYPADGCRSVRNCTHYH